MLGWGATSGILAAAPLSLTFLIDIRKDTLHQPIDGWWNESELGVEPVGVAGGEQPTPQ